LYSLNNSPLGTLNQFDNLAPGTYTLQVSGGNGCSASAVLTVDTPALIEITLTPEATITLGHSYLIDAAVNINLTEIASVTWTPSAGLECDTCLSTEAKPFSTTQYEVLLVSDAGCEARGSITLTVDKTRRVYGPNIFSPDEDGKNDVFTIFADPFSVVKIKSLQVYSRWGEEVFEQLDFAAGDTNLGWDGTFKGQKLNPAVFVWQAVVEFVDGKVELFVGDVTLQR
jgi:gliding motility-associated-like protein